MQTYYIKHKLSIGDITNLSDSDSELVINNSDLDIEDIVNIETYEKIFLARITDISKSSVEVEILEEIGNRENAIEKEIVLIQSLSNGSKFNYFLEKSVEIGIDRVIPIESQYSLLNKKKALKEYGLWQKIVSDALEQSRNINRLIIDKPIDIKDLNTDRDSLKLCLCTENVEYKHLKDIENNIKDSKKIYIAIGPEKGWSSSDINIFSNLGFEYIKLNGNILRTETAGLVISSIIKYIRGEM